ncbi:hypothetical protein CBL_13425 [Carabus blaptoides fortunei]
MKIDEGNSKQHLRIGEQSTEHHLLHCLSTDFDAASSDTPLRFTVAIGHRILSNPNPTDPPSCYSSRHKLFLSLLFTIPILRVRLLSALSVYGFGCDVMERRAVSDWCKAAHAKSVLFPGYTLDCAYWRFLVFRRELGASSLK